jgi:type III pantothenate kinase
MLLAIDIGNTKVAFGIFDGEKLRATWSVATDIHKTADEYAVLLFNLLPHEGLSVPDIDQVIICSVVPPLEPIFEQLSERYFGPHPLFVGPGVKTGVRICTDNPREVGADRVANAAAAHRLYGGPVIIIDFGTATTVDAVSKEGDYLGGAIAPGIGIAAEALFERAAKLPRIDLIAPEHAIGRNTVASMQSGVMFGYAGLIESLVSRICQELGCEARVIATGGLAGAIAKETRVVEEVNPHLTLIGLRFIHEMNR